MLKGVSNKRQDILDQEKNRQRLESDIAQLINENSVLKKQLVTLASKLDYTQRKHEEKLHDLEEREALIPEQLVLAKKEANAIINNAYTNADTIITEVLASSRQVLKEMSTVSSVSLEVKKRFNLKIQQLGSVLDGIHEQQEKNLIMFNEEHDTFFKK